MYTELLGAELNEKVKAILKEKNMTLLIDNPKEPAFIPKKRFDEVISQKNELKTQAGELTGQLEGLKKEAKGNEKLLSQIEELQQKNFEWEKKHNSSIIESAIKYRGLSEKAKDPADLLKFLDSSKLQIDKDGNVTGIDEQFKSIKELKPYLFNVDAPEKEIIKSSSGVNPSGLPGFRGQLQELQDNLKMAMEKRDTAAQIQIQNQIFELQRK